ncbi:MAG: helix-turn-helix transcriptional regulator [Eubacteriales bacterium]|nr:helix-turn-helix transcriptional regulator [Eubacteriales bacterium]
MNQDIAQEIIILRAKNGWTQQMLAEKLGTTQRTIAAWESGVSSPRKTMRVRIAQAFDLPDNYFLERAEGGTTQNQIERIIERIDGVLSESEQFGTEEGKRKILKKFQEVLSDFPTDGQDRKK